YIGRKVANSIDGRHVRLRVVILDAALANGDIHRFIPKVFVVWHAAYCDECLRDVERGVAAIVILQFVFDLSIFDFKFCKPGIAVDKHTVAFHIAFDDAHNVFVFKRQNTVSLVDQMHFRLTKAGKYCCILATDHPCPHDHHAFWKFFHVLDAVAGHDELLVDIDSRKFPRATSRCQDDEVAPHHLLIFAIRDLNFMLTDEPSSSPSECKQATVLFRGLHKREMLLEHRLPFNNGAPLFSLNFLVVDPGNLDVEAFEIFSEGGCLACKLPPRLGGERPVCDPRAADLISLDNQRLLLEIERAHSRRISGWAGANNNEVVFVHKAGQCLGVAENDFTKIGNLTAISITRRTYLSLLFGEMLHLSGIFPLRAKSTGANMSWSAFLNSTETHFCS